MNIYFVTRDRLLESRQRLLRPHQHRWQCCFKGDLNRYSCHLAYMNKTQIIGFVSLIVDDHHQSMAKLRGMAVNQEYRNQGIGALLVMELESYAYRNNVKMIRCDARQVAAGFYQKLNYYKTGQSFLKTNIGLHYVMQKQLNSSSHY